MNLRSTALSMSLLALMASVCGAHAGALPPIKVTDDNAVMACATPGRLMSFLKANNSNLPDQFGSIATEYMRHGEALGLRWDYAFFQMLVETGYLKFTGDVDVQQNNFAGLGATGKGAKGESFPDVSTGVKAHLQHILMYTGTTVDDPVAQRTRDVQAWGVLTKWQKTIKRPMTFKDLTSKWAPTSKAYPRDIASVGDRFESGPCKQDDPQPELVAEARGGAAPSPAAAAETADASTEAAKADTSAATTVAAAEPPTTSTPAPAPQPEANSAPQLDLKVINQAEKPAATSAESTDGKTGAAAKSEPPAKAAEMPTATVTAETSQKAKPSAAATGSSKTEKGKAFETAAMTGVGATAPPASSAAKCKVWQASYGGSKAIIIKAQSEKMTNYTVLDVNDGAEKREAEAYIAAYAKGGATVGEFASSAQALEKAFELCPEG